LLAVRAAQASLPGLATSMAPGEGRLALGPKDPVACAVALNALSELSALRPEALVKNPCSMASLAFDAASAHVLLSPRYAALSSPDPAHVPRAAKA
jgi:hypothetical protein